MSVLRVLVLKEVAPNGKVRPLFVVTDERVVERVRTLLVEWLRPGANDEWEQEGRYDIAMAKRLTND